MRPNRLFLMLGGCLLLGSAAVADDLGYVDCASHNDTTPVFAKARKSQDIVANVACGEKFKVLVFGFVFSEIQTSDGKVGFIYSNVMTVDRSGGTLQSRASASATPALSAASEKTKIYAEPKPPAAAPAKIQPAAKSPAEAAAAAQTAPTNNAGVRGAMIDGQAPAAQAPAPAAPATLPGPASVLKATSSSATSAEAPAAEPNPAPAAPVATPAAAPAPSATPAAVEPGATPAAATPASANPPAPAPAVEAAPKVEAAPAADAKPEVTAAPAPVSEAQPQPVEAQPQPAPPAEEVQPAITPSVKNQRWEKPNAGARTASLLELFGGFAFSRMSNGSGYPGTNFMGGMGSFGVNLKPWLQIVGDTSYSFESATGVKNVIYGNHYGPRFFLRGRSKWAISPFGEVLVGGSRADTTITGPGGSTTSQNCFSIKAGGGVDIKPSRMFEVRLIDVDYYRTAFGTNLHQSNYWVSTGVVIRLMKPWWE